VKQAERNVFLHKEEKYFRANDEDKQFYPQVTTTGHKTTSVLAWGTTGVNDGAGAVMAYCGHNILNLQMLKPFLSSEPNLQLLPNVMEGKRAVPTKSTVNWTINRNYVRNGMDNISTTWSPPLPGVNDDQLYQNLPIRCRIIRVTPKLSPGVNTQIDPSTDLFLDQLGLAYSPADDAWTVTDNEFARVNTRKYTVLGDTKFTLGQPMTATWAANFLQEDVAPDKAHWRQSLTIPDKPVLKRLTTNHQLTTKKGGSVYYDTGSEGSVPPSSGYRREYVFMHFWYESGDGGILPGTDPVESIPALVTTGKVPDALAIKIHYRVESRFREP
jgi:hypothetical protein